MILPQYHPRLEPILSDFNHGTILDGIGSAELVDSSGEIVSIRWHGHFVFK